MYSNYSIEGDIDNLYINLSLHNNSPNQVPAKIDIALEKPIVEHANNYKLSIIRFFVLLMKFQVMIYLE
jgi:hypothetical protein